MTYDDIIENWRNDAVIDITALESKAISIPLLHSKYFNIYSAERIQLKKLLFSLDKLKNLKFEYYNGSLDYETMKENNWEQIDKLILKGNIQNYIDADSDITTLKLRIAVADEKVELLKSVLNQLNGMQWNIRNAIEFLKFQAGG